jgi:phosphatidylserine decarboxylase
MATASASRAWAAGAVARVLLQEDLNFLLTNRIPRRAATRLMAKLGRVEIGWVKDLSIATLGFFAGDLGLHEARKREFTSLHDCFTRELRDGARPIDPDPAIVTSPCDAIIGAHGIVRGATVVQAKGLTYTLGELFGDQGLAGRHEGGVFVTLRLTASMYHRFHAPAPCRVREVVYVSGDTWNVNPIAVARVERLFCKNERAVVDLELGSPGQIMTMVPVAAILVGGIKLHAVEPALDLAHEGRRRIRCDASYAKGQEVGFFQAGSTILLFATGGFTFAPGVAQGSRIRVGEPLLRGLHPRPA